MGILQTATRMLGMGASAAPALAAPATRRVQVQAFDAGQSKRRLKAIPTNAAALNTQIRLYGKTVLARSRYLALNNGYAASAKDAFVSALVGDGIKPSWLVKDAALKAELQELWLAWTDEADADWITDFYGMQSIIGGEMFEAGECFVRFRPRRSEDGLMVPLQLQILPSEMLDVNFKKDLGGGRRIECGIEFDAIGRRTAYHFFKKHPGSDAYPLAGLLERTPVPASEVLHLYRPIRAGQIRGIPHTLSGMVTLALLDLYDDAELERKRTAALFGAFVTRPVADDDDHPLGNASEAQVLYADQAGNALLGEVAPPPALEPGATIDLKPGEDVKFAEPADVGASYDPFQYRNLLRAAAGFGVPYADMTGDLRATSYGSQRGGILQFRRRIQAIQNHVMIYQFCRAVAWRWMEEGMFAQAMPFSPFDYLKRKQELRQIKWIPPKWEWIDPLKDRQAEKLAVDEGWKARDDVIEAEGYDPEETDERIAASQQRAEGKGIKIGAAKTAPPQPDVEEGEEDEGKPPATNPANPQEQQQRKRKPAPAAAAPAIHITAPIQVARRKLERTVVTKYDEKGRIQEFDRFEVEED
jgi:lambda family phage portal protein